MRYSIDLETACTVETCQYHGKSMCKNDHSLSPWHSRITVAAVVGEDGSERVIRHENPRELADLVWRYLQRKPYYTVDGHSFKFDWLHLAVHGFEIPLERWVGDSSLAAYTMTEKIPDSWLADYEEKRAQLPGHHRKAGKHSLKTLAPFFLGVEPFWEPEHDHDDDEYVLKDTNYTRGLNVLLEGKLREAGHFEFYQRLLEWTKLLVRAELRGVRIDMDGLEAKERELQAKSVELRARLDEMWTVAHKAYRSYLKSNLTAKYEAMAAKAGKPMNYGSRYWKLYEAAREKLPFAVDYDSPKQMSWLLRDYLGYDIESLEGDDSTGREVLERLANEGKEDVKTYLEWRKVNKILTAFLPTYRELAARDVSPSRTAGGGVDALSGSTSGDREFALHPVYNPDSTRTGRTSSERPNAQQIPPALRTLFVARPGYKLIGYDAAAIEAKLIAYYSEDPTLYEIISSGASIHNFNVVNFFELENVAYEDVPKYYPQHRKASKNVGFALFYNAGKNRIRIAFAQAGFVISEEQARVIHKRFKEAFSTAYTFGNSFVKKMEAGETDVNLLGRPLSIENPEDAYMKAFNKLIQSSASDYLLHSAHRADQAFKAAGIDAHPLLFVHDFVAFEVEEARVNEADDILRNALIDYNLMTTLGPIKLEVEGGVMSRWEK